MFSTVTLARSLARRSVSAYRLPQGAVASRFAFFSSDSHDDFAPKRKVQIETDDEALTMIAEHVRENPVMLYMKGSPSAPMCGFSARVIQTLQEQEVDFASVDVLSYPEIRDGVKKFSDWPTIPQLYVNGEFIGGCDIITSMHESGELSDLFKGLKKSS